MLLTIAGHYGKYWDVLRRPNAGQIGPAGRPRVSEIVVHRTDGEGLPVRARRGLVEPIDARVTGCWVLRCRPTLGPLARWASPPSLALWQ
jgi:hypothetical protein